MTATDKLFLCTRYICKFSRFAMRRWMFARIERIARIFRGYDTVNRATPSATLRDSVRDPRPVSLIFIAAATTAGPPRQWRINLDGETGNVGGFVNHRRANYVSASAGKVDIERRLVS